MRKSYSLVVLTALTILTTASISKAQSSKANGANANNRQNNTDFLGWQATSALPGPLQIRNDLNQPITFHTNGFQRMHINQNTGLTNGFVGMGNGFNNPQSNLHINNPLNEETWLQITNVDVGETTTDGLRLGILDETPGQPSYGYLRWQENTPLIIQPMFVPNPCFI